jgi:hypothetical protein
VQRRSVLPLPAQARRVFRWKRAFEVRQISRSTFVRPLSHERASPSSGEMQTTPPLDPKPSRLQHRNRDKRRIR